MVRSFGVILVDGMETHLQIHAAPSHQALLCHFFPLPHTVSATAQTL